MVRCQPAVFVRVSPVRRVLSLLALALEQVRFAPPCCPIIFVAFVFCLLCQYLTFAKQNEWKRWFSLDSLRHCSWSGRYFPERKAWSGFGNLGRCTYSCFLSGWRAPFLNTLGIFKLWKVFHCDLGTERDHYNARSILTKSSSFASKKTL